MYITLTLHAIYAVFIGVGDVERVGDRAGIEAAAKLAGSDDFISRLPGRMDTMLGRTFAARSDAPSAARGAPPEQVRPVVGADRVVPEGAVVVLSDNPLGADSRIWGYIPENSIVGLVLRHR